MKAEHLFLAIGELDETCLACMDQPSGEMEATQMKHTRKWIRYLAAAAILATLLSVTAYAITSKISMNIQRTDSETEYTVMVDFRKEGTEWITLENCYPQQIPEGYTLDFVSDGAMGYRRLCYVDAAGEFAFDFTMQVGSEGGEMGFENVVSEESVTINDLPGNLFVTVDNMQRVVWYDEANGYGFAMCSSVPNLDLLPIARSVAAGETLRSTNASYKEAALHDLGDYRLTELPENYAEVDSQFCPLEAGGGWYGYVRRWYGDSVSTENMIYFEYEHFNLVSDEPMEHADPDEWDTPEDILKAYVGGEPTTVQGMPAAVTDGFIRWVDWDAKIMFSICAEHLNREAIQSLADSVHAAE